MAERPHDIALFGATGFTGRLTAEYLARNAPSETRWALAGRRREKLERLRDELCDANPQCGDLDVVVADIEDDASVRELAEAARVVMTTVGPYTNYGEPLVAACASAGTDYLDLTGEPEFVDRMWLAYHDRAQASGARIVHSCGFDSIPHDLGAYHAVLQLPADAPIRLEGFVSASGSFSGGTYQSAITAFSRMRQYAQVSRERRRREQQPAGRRVRAFTGRIRYHRDLQRWVVPFPSIDPQVITRSARAVDRYGPDFAYGHYLQLKNLPTVVGLAGGVTGLMALAQVPPARDWLLGRRGSGEGPTPEQRAKGWFRVRFAGESDGRRVVTEVRGGDPGYGETSKLLAESALCLAHDPLSSTAGQVTPAAAMGDALLARLQAAGIEFRVLESA
jgi:short subunit dehydrogenase-like uncharacterized protein